MTMATMVVAKERQLDWLLGEVLGGALGSAPGRPARAAAPVRASRWLAAAIAVCAAGVAIGVAVLREDDGARSAQEPAVEAPWHECHGPQALDAVPADVTALKCFDFDDAACARLTRFTKLERLDLSGMDVNDKGYAVSLKITDAGVQALGALANLRWLSLATCHDLKGAGLQALEALPRLEHLDLTYSGVESPAIERLGRLPSLRTLVLSHCMNFHGRSLAAVAAIPGLRRLDLRACTTLAAKDVLHLVKLKELRWLDLRDCQGRFRGQTAVRLDDVTNQQGEEPPPPPVQDGIGITDDVVAALAALPLETLLLGGSESLTDAIGEPLVKMTTLRALDLSNLPKTTGALLAKVPNGLEELRIDDNGQFAPMDLAKLPALPGLSTFGLSGMALDELTLERLLADKPLRRLALGGRPARSKGERQRAFAPLPPSASRLIARCRDLESLDLRDASFVDRAFLAAIANLPRLQALDLTGPLSKPLLDRSEAVRGLAANRTIRSLALVWNRLTLDSLRQLRDLPLRELDLYGSNLPAGEVKELASSWPGCSVRLPNGERYRAP